MFFVTDLFAGDTIKTERVAAGFKPCDGTFAGHSGATLAAAPLSVIIATQCGKREGQENGQAANEFHSYASAYAMFNLAAV